MMRRYDLPGTALSVVFLSGVKRTRVEIRNGANGTVVDLSEDVWAQLVDRARYVRALAQPVESPEPVRDPLYPTYTLYAYTPEHRAIDCEGCDRKLANLKPGTIGASILDRLIAHEQGRHT